MTQATSSLVAYTGGSRRAADALLPLVYDRLRTLASRYMSRERVGHILQPTALVHEAYIRLIDIDQVDWRSKAHFYAMAARQMRRILIEDARKRLRGKHGGGLRRVTLAEDLAITSERVLDLLAFDEALTLLARRHEREARVAELRVFAGMHIREIALVLDVSKRTIDDDWRFARVWLKRQLDSKGRDP
jgi:RNA polymerase sigma factor (TIGR02999 family)